MRVVEALAVIVVLALLCWAIWALVGQGLRERRVRDARWRVAVHSTDDGGTVVLLEKPGEEPQRFRTLPPEAGDADLEEALIEADNRAQTFNATLARR